MNVAYKRCRRVMVLLHATSRTVRQALFASYGPYRIDPHRALCREDVDDVVVCVARAGSPAVREIHTVIVFRLRKAGAIIPQSCATR